MSVFVAKVKNVLSGDSVVLVPSKTNQFPPPERLLTLEHVRPIDEFESREYLRQLLIGKEIKFKVSAKAATREFGDIQSPIFKSLIEYLLAQGYVKLRDGVNAESDDYIYELTQIENAAKLKQAGLWADNYTPAEIVPLTEEIIAKSQGKPIKLIVEKVISGDRIVGRLILNKKQHSQTTLLLAGLKAPRTDDTTQPAHITKVAQQAKQFVEDKLLTTKAELTASIIGESQSGVPIAIINHSSGNNIHEKLLESGFAEIVDWQSTLVGSSQMSVFRKAEQTAKALGKGIFANATIAKKPAVATSSSKLRPGNTIEGVTIAKVINADTILIRLPHSDEEVTVQLASIRAPKPNDTTVTTDSAKQQALVATAREFVRHQVIGKQGTLYVDGYRDANKDLGLEARLLVSFKYGNTDLSEFIVTNGFGTVIKHNKATQHERSMNWDKLVELEEEAKKTSKKGIYGDLNKVLTVGTRIIDASENFTKAKTFFNGFKQKGRISGYYVEFVPSTSRVKLFNPKEGMKLTLILGGLSNDKQDSLNEDGVKFLNKKFLQRPVEFEIYDTDKLGGFIGNLYANANAISPVQQQLLEQGVVKVHEYAVNSNPAAASLIKAEEDARNSKKGVWAGYDPAKVEKELAETTAKLQSASLDAAKPKFFDIEVVDIDPTTGVLSFHLLDVTTTQKFTQFKQAFQQFHAQQPSASQASTDLPFKLTKGPRKNELVSAKFSENGKFYRARVINFDKSTGKYEVKHLDFGNVDKVALSSLRALPDKFNVAKYPVFAHTTTLQNVRLPPSKPTDYLTDAVYALEDLVYDRKLVISALPGATAEYEGVLYDAEQSLTDSSYTINKQLVKEGWGIVDSKVVKPAVKEYVTELLAAQREAKSKHLGCWEFGDVSFDEESLLA
ncbi:Nuclease domain-containing protein 1 [Candida viswanathii]|uniref:Nuclease domain-containing protein 1 n=1 Tax=Candida viswanathii TaxID=5486 RepID=A0A367YK07_9ASCO|nr:Nuclease domain-containing protein 1 [Candida viswanathii]